MVNSLCVWCLEHSACCRKCCRCRGPWYCCSDARSAGAPNSCMPASSFRGHAGGGSWNMQWECRGGGEYLRNDKKVKWCSDFTFGRVWCGGLCGLQTLLFLSFCKYSSPPLQSHCIFQDPPPAFPRKLDAGIHELVAPALLAMFC